MPLSPLVNCCVDHLMRLSLHEQLSRTPEECPRLTNPFCSVGKWMIWMSKMSSQLNFDEKAGSSEQTDTTASKQCHSNFNNSYDNVSLVCMFEFSDWVAASDNITPLLFGFVQPTQHPNFISVSSRDLQPPCKQQHPNHLIVVDVDLQPPCKQTTFS